MEGNLETALRTLVASALPGLFGGSAPAVALTVLGDVFDVDPDSLDATAGEPRPDDRTDQFTFNPAQPAGPYTLSQPPYPGPRRVWLTTSAGDRSALREQEIVWDALDSRVFSLDLRPNRELAGVDGVQVLYGVTAVFTKIKAAQTIAIQLKSADAARLRQAEALVVAVVQLQRQQLIDQSAALYEDGDYGARAEIKSLKLVHGARPADDTRLLTLLADVELKASRALDDQEGRPIRRIRTPGRPLDPNRPVDIDMDVES